MNETLTVRSPDYQDKLYQQAINVARARLMGKSVKIVGTEEGCRWVSEQANRIIALLTEGMTP